MASAKARQRTESMAQRLAKQPMSEGFVLWDRGYNLGAMRLFIFKAENSPPFQLGPCLDGIAHLCARMGEAADANENFGYAAEKYSMIQQPVLGKVMTIKGIEATEGAEKALAALDDLLKEHDPERKAPEMAESKTKMNLGRAYQYRAELLLGAERFAEAEADARLATYCPQEKPGKEGDRTFLAHYTLGCALAGQEKTAEAIASFEQALLLNANYIGAYEELLPLYSATGNKEKLKATAEAAIKVHPKSALIRQLAFAMSDLGQDTEALAMLDGHIANPPHEETEALFTAAGQATAVFQKAKAAILADAGKMAEAAACVAEALKAAPGDEEATSMETAIKEALAEEKKE